MLAAHTTEDYRKWDAGFMGISRIPYVKLWLIFTKYSVLVRVDSISRLGTCLGKSNVSREYEVLMLPRQHESAKNLIQL